MKTRRLMVAPLAVALLAAACGADTDEDVDDAAESVAEEVSDAVEDASSMADDAMEDDESDDGDDSAAGGDIPDPLVFTLTPSAETGGLIETAEPLAQLLSEKLGVDVEATVPTDYAGVIAALESDQAQLAGGLGPRQMVQAQAQADATLLLQSSRFGAFSYNTQWFTNDPDTFCEGEPVAVEQDEGEPFLFCNGVEVADEAGDANAGPIGDEFLPNVEGETVAFVEAGSTSGFAVPLLQLLGAGVDPFTGIDQLEAGSHDNSVQAVYDGDAVVGVSFNDARGNLVEQTPDVGQEVVVFGWSGPIPNDGFAVSSSLSDEAAQMISDALVEICEEEAECEEGGLLNELYSIEGLAPVEDGVYDQIRDLEDQLGEQLG